MSKAPVIDPFAPPEPGTAASNGTPLVACKPEVMTITPDLAREWTVLNTRNRPVRYTKVAQYARDMAAGKWLLNGETIKIATDGTILDGQHRLYACMQAEVPFQSIVIGSVWGMAWLLFHGSDHLAADVFLEKILTGEDCKSGDPVLAFRNRIWNAREAGERLTTYQQLAYMIIAWNAFKDGRPLKILKFTNGKLTPKNFPEPK